MNTEIVDRIIARFSAEERRVMSMPTVQLAMLDGKKGITIEKHDAVPASTLLSLKTRNLAAGKRAAKTGILPLTMLGEAVVERLAEQR